MPLRCKVSAVLAMVGALVVGVVSLAAPAAASGSVAASTLGAGQRLVAGGQLTNGPIRLVMQTDGSLAMYRVGVRAAVWSVRSSPQSFAQLQHDGNFVVYRPDGRPAWSTATRGAGARLVLSADGRLQVILGGRAAWDSSYLTVGKRTTSKLLVGQSMTRGVRLAAGRVSLVLQGDGNLVRYVRGKPMWASNTVGRGYLLTLQSDGNLVLTDRARRPVWNSGTAGTGSDVLTVRSSGAVGLYSGTVATWSATMRAWQKPIPYRYGAPIGILNLAVVGYQPRPFVAGGPTLATSQAQVNRCRIAEFNGLPGSQTDPRRAGIVWLAAHANCSWQRVPSLKLGARFDMTVGRDRLSYRVVDRVVFPSARWTGRWSTKDGVTRLQIHRTVFDLDKSYVALQTCLPDGRTVVYFASR